MGYVQDGSTLLVGTDSPWWKNLRGGAPVQMRLRGEQRQGVAEVFTDPAAIQPKLRTMIAGGPQLGEIFGVRLDPNGEPILEDVKGARERGFVVVQIQLK